MCTSPLHIRNPRKKYFNPAIDKAWLDVPCGHCWQCRQNKRNDMFVRCYFEHLKVEENGGYSVFFTLTYSNDYMPTVSPLAIPCFDKSHLQLYMKRLRSRLARICKKYQWGTITTDDKRHKRFVPVTSGNITYMINGEYGTKTHRPHYHCIFHVNCLFPRYLFLQEAKKAWNDQGFTYSSKHANGIINGIGAIKYVTNYVTKNFIEDEYLKQVRDIVKDEISIGAEEREFIYDVIEPPHLHSTHYGTYAISQFLTEEQKEACHIRKTLTSLPQTKDSIYNCQILLPDKDKGMRQYMLPLYLQRFLFYRTEIEEHIIPKEFENTEFYKKHKPKTKDVAIKKDVSYVLNSEGRKSRQMRLNEFLKASADTFKFCLGSRPYEEKQFIEYLNKHYPTKYTAYEDYKNELLTLSDNLSSDFLDWSFYYRGYIDSLDCPPCEQLDKQSTFYSPRDMYESLLQYDRFQHTCKDFSPLDGVQFTDIFKDQINAIHHVTKKHTTYYRAYELFNILIQYYNCLKDVSSYNIEYDTYQNKLLKNPT